MFNTDRVPVTVRAVAVPPTVMPVAAPAVMVPSLRLNVTVRLPLAASTSTKGVPVKSRLFVTSSVTVKLAGAVTRGASLTAVMEVVRSTVAKL